MKFRCPCDAIIHDQSDNLPHKAWLLPDESAEQFETGASEMISAYFDAVLAGRESHWLSENVSEEYSKLGLDRESIIHDLIVRFHIRLKRTIYLCDKCGRLFVSHRQTKDLIAYSPDNLPAPTDILRRSSTEGPA